MINLNETVAEQGIEPLTSEYAVKHSLDCTMEHGFFWGTSLAHMIFLKEPFYILKGFQHIKYKQIG